LSIAKLENGRNSPFSFLAQFSSRASDSTTQIPSRGRSPSSASSSSRSSPDSPPIHFSTSTQTSKLRRHISVSTNTSDVGTVPVGHTASFHGHSDDVVAVNSVSGESGCSKDLTNDSTPLSNGKFLDDGNTATLVANTGTQSDTVSERVGDEEGTSEGQVCNTASPLPSENIDRTSHSNLRTETMQLSRAVQNGMISESAASSKTPDTSSDSIPITKTSHPAQQFPHGVGSPIPFIKKLKQDQSTP